MTKADTVRMGTLFGRLEVASEPFTVTQPSGKKRRSVIAICECGQISRVNVCNLTSGNSTQCRSCAISHSKRTHGESGWNGKRHPIYEAWASMRGRCLTPSNTAYKSYGGRGIAIAAEWYDYLTFKSWALSHGWAPGLELDREDPDGNYGPENCQWITKRANIRRRDIAWDESLDQRLVETAQRLQVTPYELIRSAVEQYLDYLNGQAN